MGAPAALPAWLAVCRSQSLLERRVDEDGGSGALAICLRVMSEVQQQVFALGGWAGAFTLGLLGA